MITLAGAKRATHPLLQLLAALSIWCALTTSAFCQGQTISHGSPIAEIVKERASTAESGESDPSNVLDALASVRDIVTMLVSPDKTKVALLVRHADPAANRYQQDWLITSVASPGSIRRIADGGDATLRIEPNGIVVGELGVPPAAWSPDSQWIAYARSAQGTNQLWRAAAGGDVVEQLGQDAGEIQAIHWSSDSAKIYVTVGRDWNAAKDADRVEGLRGMLIGEPMPDVHDPARRRWPDCKPPSPFQINSVAEADLACQPVTWVYDLDGKSKRPATPAETAAQQEPSATPSDQGPVALSSVGVLSSDGRYEAVYENPDPGKFAGVGPPTRLTMVDVRTGRKIPCLKTACTSFDFGVHRDTWWSPDGVKIIFLLTLIEGPVQTLYEWTPAGGRLRRIWSSDEWQLRECTKAKGELICIRNGWTRPDHLVGVDLASGAIRILADPNIAMHGLPHPKVETIHYDDGMGLATYAHLVYPLHYVPGRKYPLVVVQYRSRGFLRGAVGDEQPILAYAAAGMFVLSTNLAEDLTIEARLKDMRALTVAEWDDFNVRKRPLKAIKRALEMLDRRGLIDPNRLGISGLSTGATITEQALVDSDMFAAASAAYANVSPLNYYTFPSTQDRKVLLGGHPFFGKGLAMWRKESIGLNAVDPDRKRNINTPYLLQVADREYYYSLQNYVDLKDSNAPVELYVFPDEHHVKWQPAHRLAVYRRNLAWFRYWLQGVKVDNPLDPQQYVRWEKLRVQRDALKAH